MGGASFFRLMNIITSILVILGGILLFVDNGTFNSCILGVFVVLFGALTFALEFTIPEAVVYNMGFMFSLLGRGIFYLSMGLLCLSWKWFNIVVGCIIMAVGVFFIFMHFKGASPSPSMSAKPNTSTTNLNPSGQMQESYTNPTGTGIASVVGTPQLNQPATMSTPIHAGSFQSPNPNAVNPVAYQSPSVNAGQQHYDASNQV